MATLILVRHGETDWNRDRRVQGQTDLPLNETGRAQARALAEQLAGTRVDAVYASDLARARETAELLAAQRGLTVTLDPALREKDFGSWEGLTDVEVLDRFPDAVRGAWGDAETPDELSARVLAALERIAARHPNEHVVVVTHGGPVRAVLRHCSSANDGPIANCHVVRIRVENGVLRAVD